MNLIKLPGALLLGLALGSISVTAATIWADDASADGGDGTEAAPFHWGNSAELFDRSIRGYGEGTVFHLAHIANTANVFQTQGAYANSLQPEVGFQLKTGQQILGGLGVTIRLVHVVPNKAPGTGFNIALGAISPFHPGGRMASQVLVQDITVDCNGPALKAQRNFCTLQGIELAGSGNTLRNVTVVNAINDRALASGYDEVFIMSLSTHETNSSGNLIDRCTILNFSVDKAQSGTTNVMCSAMSLRVLARDTNCPYHISGTIQNCLINLNGERPGKYSDQEYAINSTFASNLTITGNVINGANRGFGNDTAPNSCIVITQNIFNQPAKSWGLMLASSSDSLVQSNRFNLRGPGAVAIGVQGPSNGQQATRWSIRDNRFDSTLYGNSGIYFWPAPNTGPNLPRYITVENNLFTGKRSYINVPINVASGCNYLAGNRGAFAYYNLLTEPVGIPCPSPPVCLNF